MVACGVEGFHPAEPRCEQCGRSGLAECVGSGSPHNTNTCDVNPDSDPRRRRLRHRADDDDNAAEDDESDEVVEVQCICSNTSFNVRSVAALCAACIAQNGKTTDGKGLSVNK